jgi:hypothetical protein
MRGQSQHKQTPNHSVRTHIRKLDFAHSLILNPQDVADYLTGMRLLQPLEIRSASYSEGEISRIGLGLHRRVAGWARVKELMEVGQDVGVLG